MASSSRDLIVKFLADTSDLVAGVRQADGALGKLKTAATIAGGALVAGFAAKKVVDFLGDATKAAEEDAKSQALLAQQLKVSTNATDDQIKSTEEFINKLERQTGVMDDDLRPAFSQLARATGSTEKAQSELAVAMDIAAARGVSLESVTTALEKAHNGNTGALGRMGLATKDAAGNVLTLDQIMGQAATTYAGAAEAAITPSQRWNVAFQELKEQVGTALLPALSALAGFMADTLLPAIQDAVAWVEEHWPEISATVKEDVDKIMGYVTPVLDEISDLWERFGTHILDVVKGAFDGIVGSIKTGVALIQAVVQPLVDILHGDWGKAWDDFKRRIGDAWDGIKQQVEGAVEYVKGVIGGLVELVKGVPAAIASALDGMWDVLWKDLAGAVAKVKDMWNAIADKTHISIHIPDWVPGFGGKGFDANLLPHLAKGGTIAETGVAVVHKGETVVPAGAGGPTFSIANLTVVANSPNEVAKALVDYARMNGGLRVPGGVTAT